MGWAVGTALAIAVWGIWRNSLPRLRMWCLLFLGALAAGLAGVFDSHIAHGLTTVGNSITGKILGIVCGVAFLVAFMTIEFWDSAKPGKEGKGGSRWGHSIMAFIFPEVVLASSSMVAAALGIGTSVLVALPGTVHGLF